MSLAISKSKYLQGVQCPLLIWTSYNQKEEIPPPDAATQAIFDLGHQVGKFAQQCWPDGVEVPMLSSLQAKVERTRELLRQRIPIFEASFLVDRRYCQVDILEPAEGDSWNLIEVKASTRVKDINLQDVAFQADALRRAGVPLNRLYLMHINNQYRRRGAIEPEELFSREDVTSRACALQDSASERTETLLNLIDGPRPDVTIGLQCDDPYECPLKQKCWAFLPQHNALELYRISRRKAFEHIHSGRVELTVIPQSELNEKQRIQQGAVAQNAVHVEREPIRRWLDRLHYPLYHFDFETMNPGIPLFDGTRPFQQIPFQFSLHIQDGPGAEPRRIEFLAEEPGDPRPALIDALGTIGSSGTVLAFNMSFERRILRELATDFPAHELELLEIANRLEDLATPFQNFWYYNAAQKGSCSLKKVLPAVTGTSYEGMAVASGDEAAREYLRAVYGDVEEDGKAQVLNALRTYCQQDTRALVDIIETLETLT